MAILISVGSDAVDDPEASVDVADDALRGCIEEALGKNESEPVTRREMATLQRLTCREQGVVQLSGIEFANNLEHLELFRNQFYDLTPLAHLTKLRVLHLGHNRFDDLTPFVGLTEMRMLHINDTYYLSDITPLAAMSKLWRLDAGTNRISDLTPLKGLTALRYLYLGTNWISDLTPLQGLTALSLLNLGSNQISDVAPLLSNREIDTGDLLGLERNPLSHKAVNVDIPELLERGVTVRFDPVDPTPSDATVVQFSDRALERAIRRRLQKGDGWPITAEELSRLKGLALAGLGIKELAGLEFATGLERLDLSNNLVTDLRPLASLTSLAALWLGGNPVSDISPIAGLSSIQSLTLDDTEVVDLAPLANRPSLFSLALDGNSVRDVSLLEGNFNLNHLSLGRNQISDFSALSNLPHLQWLSLNGNRISALPPLTGLPNLRHLNIDDNQVSDLSPLEDHPSLEELLARNNRVGDLSMVRGGELAFVALQGNPLDDDAVSHGGALRNAGVTALLGHVVPYFPAVGGNREGFVRVINRGAEGGDVFIEAVDDAGVRSGILSLPVGPLGAKHINSGDLERGNPAKGLSAGIGRPTAGDWRLELTSPLDIEVLSYVRTEDGFVTAMHDVAADSFLPFFNPGANTSQRSILRVVNTEAGAAKLQMGGYHDNGGWRGMLSAVLVKQGHSFTATAQDLEETHGLGVGFGRWRLRVPEWPWLAMGLLESPTGHLTNLSTAPANTEPLANGVTRHRLPLFLAAGGSRESFARVVNHSPQAGEVEIEGIDDAGNVLGLVRLNVPSRKTVHFNSRDLQNGNAAKGLSGGLGAGDGDWRLALTTALDIQVLSYVRTADGFVTAMHDLAPMAEDGGRRIVFFNPGSNTAQLSKLRLMNDGDEAAQVTITGIDDEGMPSGTVALTLADRSALTLTAAQLEAGGDGLSGRLGDGTGKWRLRVHSDAPLAVMSLLESPTGHLTNLSTATAKVERRAWPASAGGPLAR